MILLDANYLILIAGGEPTAEAEVDAWMESGHVIATSSIAWSEFVTGPLLAEDRKLIESLIGEAILPFGRSEAEQAAHLFRHAGCRRAFPFGFGGHRPPLQTEETQLGKGDKHLFLSLP
jgi:predicted nucleic acid-binding protein